MKAEPFIEEELAHIRVNVEKLPTFLSAESIASGAQRTIRRLLATIDQLRADRDRIARERDELRADWLAAARDAADSFSEEGT